MCPHLSANYVLGCPSNMAQVSVWAGNLQKALSFTATPSYKSIKNILDTGNDQMEMPDKGKATGSHTEPTKNSHALTRGADYYRR